MSTARSQRVPAPPQWIGGGTALRPESFYVVIVGVNGTRTLQTFLPERLRGKEGAKKGGGREPVRRLLVPDIARRGR